jgi:predicted nuclease of predicted toxin-antitoxin system
MRFLVDASAGKTLADWLRMQGHDVLRSTEIGPDPGDETLLRLAARDDRIVIVETQTDDSKP